ALINQKIDRSEYQTLLKPSLLKLIELCVADGAVRDILMVINPHDVDFAATATPEQIKHMLSEPNIRMINANGEQHGTITTRIDDKDNFEITT
ncbi:unnamed protein product, partial [Rotaria socialis]